MGDHQPVGFADGVEDGRLIQRAQRAGIDHLDADALPLQLGGGAQRPGHHGLGSHQGDVGAGPLDHGLADGDGIGRLRHGHRLGQVKQLVLEENHRVVVPDGGGQQPLGLVGRGGGHHHQARNVGEPRLQALAVLRGQPDAAPLRPADDEGHGIPAAQHVAEFRGLVDDHVHHQRDEIENLHLDDRPQPCNGGSHPGPAKGGLGDGGVPHPLRPEGGHQPLGRLENSAGFRHVLSHQDHRGVPLHLLVHRLRERLREGPFPRPRVARLLVIGMGGIDGADQDALVRLGALPPERHRLLQLLVHLALNGGDPLAGTFAAVGELFFDLFERIAVHPRFLVLEGARIGQVGTHAVLTPAPGEGLDQARPLTGPGPLHRLPDDAIHLQGVIAVDGLPWNAVGRGAHRNRVHRGGIAKIGVEGVLVVLAQEDDRQLPYRGQVQRLVKNSLVRPAVPEKRHHHLALAPHFGCQRRPRADRHGRRDDPVGSQDVEVQIGDVHRAPQAAAVAGLAPHQLGHHFPDAGPLGDAMAVAAVSAADEIVRAQVQAGPGGDGLLAHVAVGGSLHQPALEQFGGLLLEPADAVHGGVEPIQQIGFGGGLCGPGGGGHGVLLGKRGRRRGSPRQALRARDFPNDPLGEPPPRGRAREKLKGEMNPDTTRSGESMGSAALAGSPR